MAISARDRKLLWTRSGNECAFPACEQELVLNSSGSDMIVGREAHIHSRNQAGPRGSGGLSPSDLDGYGNVILLCPTHHAIVDAQPDVFPVETLREMKLIHERSVRERQQGWTRAQEVVFDPQCRGRPVNIWQVGPSTLVGCSYGSPPVVNPFGRWRGSGIEFRHYGPGGYSEVLLDSSEVLPDIDYWLEGTRLHVVRSTFLFDTHSFVPFAEQLFDLGTVPADVHVLKLMEGDDTLVPTVSALVDHLLEAESYEESRGFLGALFRAGMAEPESVLSQFDRIMKAECLRGGEAIGGRIMERELRLMRDGSSSLESARQGRS